MKEPLYKATLISALALIPITTNAQAEPRDYDVNKNGLIEIRSLEDFLALPLTSAPSSVHLNGFSDGCPERGCIGYELVTDLDFSSMPNIRLNERSLLNVIFEGNHHTIKNLSLETFGLFEVIYESDIRNLTIENIELRAPGTDYLGTLTPMMTRSTLVNVEVSGTLHGQHFTGGLVGVDRGSVILNSHFSGTIHAPDASFAMGGLVGSALDTLIYASSAHGKFDVQRPPNNSFTFGGLIGGTHHTNAIIASYANFENTQVSLVGNLAAQWPVIIQDSYAIYRTDSDEPATVVAFYAKRSQQEDAVSITHAPALTDLACPQSELDERCNFPDLLRGWHQHEDSTGQRVWDLGSSTDLPAIRRDLVFDLTDRDQDGVLDLLDHFPDNAAAYLDFDQDGKPDAWRSTCDRDCQEASGLRLDNAVGPPPYRDHPSDHASSSSASSSSSSASSSSSSTSSGSLDNGSAGAGGLYGLLLSLLMLQRLRRRFLQ